MPIIDFVLLFDVVDGINGDQTPGICASTRNRFGLVTDGCLKEKDFQCCCSQQEGSWA